ncbi:MAG TPA: SEC-C metal-binding domain-containing protein [Saprospiraceae bacterium]|nr:SEC-C metal-binding domain-containing protein [Saprospiraceae bacterium]
MENTCNYSDNWQPYIGDYDKFEYDIKLKDGTIVENCYPNAGKFNSISEQHDQQQFEEDQVLEIRFSNKPRYLIGNPFSSKVPDEEYVKSITNQIEETRESASKLQMYSGMFGGFMHGLWLDDADYLPPHKRARKIIGRHVPIRTEPKIGRNEPCPCGSGKKFKKCCNEK